MAAKGGYRVIVEGIGGYGHLGRLVYNEQGSEVRCGFLLRYLITYRKLVVQLLFWLGIGSILQLIMPFLTQSVVDLPSQ